MAGLLPYGVATASKPQWIGQAGLDPLDAMLPAAHVAVAQLATIASVAQSHTTRSLMKTQQQHNTPVDESRF